MENTEELGEEEEISIFIITEDPNNETKVQNMEKEFNEKSYNLEVKTPIKYKDLKIIIKEKILGTYHFYIIYEGKKYDDEENEDEFMYLSEGDKLYAKVTIIKECSTNVKFHLDGDINEADKKCVKLTGILHICLVDYIAQKLNNINLIKNPEVKYIISEFKKDTNLEIDAKEDIKQNLKRKEGNNILTYMKYIKEIITINEISNLFKLFNKAQLDDIINHWSILSKYEAFNKLFERNFSEALNKSYFEYSLIGVSIYEQKRKKEFLDEINKCCNPQVKYLFHGSQIDNVANIITTGFLYTRKPFYGMGIYFSDMLDYISFYSGGNNYKNRRKNFGKTLPLNETFSCVGSAIFYDNDKKKEIYDTKYHIKELDHFPDYDEIVKNYKKKMVEKNGVHFVRVEPERGQVIKGKTLVDKAIKKGKFIGTEYVITEMSQILALYGLTLKRDEYCVIWRDPNFAENNKDSQYIHNILVSLYKDVNINIYTESCTEKALELINRKRHNKIILITSIGKDLSGKTFVQIARKLLGFDVMVLFFSGNRDHLVNWVSNFPNALFSNQKAICEEYIKNYNKIGLLNLKEKIENFYKVKLTFKENFLQFPNFIESKVYKDIIFEQISPYYKRAIIKNRSNKLALFMNDKGKVECVPYEGRYTGNLIWYITLMDNDITMFSNNYYLNYDEKNKIINGFKYMIRWKFEKLYPTRLKRYLIYYENKNNILTIDGDNVTLKKYLNIERQKFYFTDI